MRQFLNCIEIELHCHLAFSDIYQIMSENCAPKADSRCIKVSILSNFREYQWISINLYKC